jgi:hypothetical protein
VGTGPIRAADEQINNAKLVLVQALKYRIGIFRAQANASVASKRGWQQLGLVATFGSAKGRALWRGLLLGWLFFYCFSGSSLERYLLLERSALARSSLL